MSEKHQQTEANTTTRVIHMIPIVDVDIEVSEPVADVLEKVVTMHYEDEDGNVTKTVAKAPCQWTEEEYYYFLSLMNKKSILTGVFGKDAQGIPFITKDGLLLLTVLHGFNFNRFAWKPHKGEYKFKAPKTSALPQHVLIATKIIDEELGPVISLESEAAVHFMSVIELGPVLREQPCRDVFRDMPAISFHPTEKKKEQPNKDGFTEEISIEPINRPLEQRFKTTHEYDAEKVGLPEHRTYHEEDGSVVVFYDVIKADDEYYRKVVVDHFGFKPTPHAIVDCVKLLQVTLSFIYGIDAIIRDPKLKMLSDDGKMQRSKMYMLSDECWRIARAYHCVRAGKILGSLTPEILQQINPEMTLETVQGILTKLSGFYEYYSQALKAADDAFNSLLCPEGSPIEAWVKTYYSYEITYVPPPEAMEVDV